MSQPVFLLPAHVTKDSHLRNAGDRSIVCEDGGCARTTACSAPTTLVRVLLVLTVALLGLAYGASANAADLDLKQYAGKVVYLDFWASWCAPCQQSFPWMNATQAEFKSRGLVVVAVNLDKDEALARKFLRSHPANFTIVYDPSGSLASAYDIKAMPTSLIVGRDGRVRAVHQGFHQDEEFNYVSDIQAALNEAPHTAATP